MRVIIASDHAGLRLKEKVKKDYNCLAEYTLQWRKKT